MSRFVVVVDTQFDFIASDGALNVAGADALVEPMQAWLDGLHPDDTAGILFTFDTHVPEIYAGSPEAKAFPVHCVTGTPGWENVLGTASIRPSIPIWRLEKGVFDMWEEEVVWIDDARMPYRKPVRREDFFASLQAQGIREVVVIGVAADYCVRWAIEGLVARGFDVAVPHGLTRGIEREIEVVVADEFAPGMVSIVGR